MFGKLIVFILVLASINGWVLKINQHSVTPQLTSNVTILCHIDDSDNNSKSITIPFLIQIQKYINKTWQTVASMPPREQLAIAALKYTTMNGYVDTPASTYIGIVFNVASTQTIGQYRCAVAGLDKNFIPKSIKTEPVSITENKVTYSYVMKIFGVLQTQENGNSTEWAMVKYFFVQMYSELQKATADKNTLTETIVNNTLEINDLSNKIVDLKMIINNITTHQEIVINDQSNKMGDLKMYMSTAINNITTHQGLVDDGQLNMLDDLKIYIKNITTHQDIVDKNIGDNIKSLTETLKVIVDVIENSPHKLPIYTWPASDYALWKPDTGCPNNLTSTWTFSSIRISTAPNDNKDSASDEMNLFGNVFQKIGGNNYVQIEMCRHSSNGRGPVWPKGSYCLAVYSDLNDDDSDCPKGFHRGMIHIGRFQDGSKDIIKNLPGYVFHNDETRMYFCCRNDGLPTNPIILPRQHPFYLFRYGGRCQDVAGLTVSNQWIHYDTGKWGEKDRPENNYNPDGSFTNGLTIEICYYTPSV